MAKLSKSMVNKWNFLVNWRKLLENWRKFLVNWRNFSVNWRKFFGSSVHKFTWDLHRIKFILCLSKHELMYYLLENLSSTRGFRGNSSVWSDNIHSYWSPSRVVSSYPRSVRRSEPRPGVLEENVNHIMSSGHRYISPVEGSCARRRPRAPTPRRTSARS